MSHLIWFILPILTHTQHNILQFIYYDGIYPRVACTTSCFFSLENSVTSLSSIACSFSIIASTKLLVSDCCTTNDRIAADDDDDSSGVGWAPLYMTSKLSPSDREGLIAGVALPRSSSNRTASVSFLFKANHRAVSPRLFALFMQPDLTVGCAFTLPPLMSSFATTKCPCRIALIRAVSPVIKFR